MHIGVNNLPNVVMQLLPGVGFEAVDHKSSCTVHYHHYYYWLFFF